MRYIKRDGPHKLIAINTPGFRCPADTLSQICPSGAKTTVSRLIDIMSVIDPNPGKY